MRKEINEIVRAYAMAHNGTYQQTWNVLYRMYNKVLHQNIKSRATRRHVRPLDVVEQEKNLETLKILALALFA